jgi:elongator complex protein 3
MTKVLDKFILGLAKLSPTNEQELSAAKRRLAKQLSCAIPNGADLIAGLSLLPEAQAKPLKKLLKKRAVRTMSGIAPVAVLTTPYPCPGRCAYCPTDKDVPQSYLANEPAVMRAIHCKFDPYEQVIYRLTALEANGHEPTKIELIVIGGTWSALPEAYQYWFIKECFRAANDYPKQFPISNFQFSNKSQITISKPLNKSFKTKLFSEQKRNETAKYKIIGLTLETRPDYINEAELWRMRELGATRVEIGVQALDDKILKLNRRGSTVADIIQATKLLKNFGFKVTYHFMPALPGSTPARDRRMYQDMFTKLNLIAEIIINSKTKPATLKKFLSKSITNNNFDPDQIKFYPTVVTKGSLLYRWWKAGKYKPYSDKTLRQLIIDCKAMTPPFVRIIRLIRDIPGVSIMAGNKITNLRQIMKEAGVVCHCLRCREAGSAVFTLADVHLFIQKYRASGSDEYFISFASRDQNRVYGFARLRLGPDNVLSPATALLRELHVYGELVSVGARRAKTQHQGLGKRLLFQAETLARLAGYTQMAVISGVGVRGYYKKLGYSLHKTYLVKTLIITKTKI